MTTNGRKIGEIAQETGMTVRTLRYYEEIGLLQPQSRTESGHRLYGQSAVARLYQISMLRSLGLSLHEIEASLADGGRADVRSLMTEHLAAVDARLVAENRVRTRLANLVGTLETEDATSDLLRVLEDMTTMETNLDKRIAILVYDDLEAAFDYLTRVFGFGPGELTRAPDGAVVHGELQAGDGVIWLHPPAADFGLSTPNDLGGASATMAIMVGDVDAHYAFAVEQGATVRYEPMDQPYGYREYGAIDLDGHLWSFMKALPDA